MIIKGTTVGIEHLEYYLAAARTEEQQRQAAAAGAANYYGSDAPIGPGMWMHAGNMGVQVGTEISAGQLRDLLACRDPGTGEKLGRTYKVGGEYVDRRGITRLRRSVSAFDLTMSVPKSVSAAWAIAPAEVRSEIEQAVLAAVDVGVTYIQQHAVVSRKGTNGVEAVPVPDGATVARFVHTTSRSGDPQLHAHTLWPNRVLCDDEQWRTLDGRAIFSHCQPAGVLASAVLRAEITSRLGWAWNHVDERNHADLAGTPVELLEAWSQRRHAVERHAADAEAEFERATHREPTPEQRHLIWEQAALATRAAKTHIDLVDPHERWAAEAAAAGCAPERIIERLETAEVPERERYAPPELVISDPVNPAAALDSDLADALLAHVEVTKTRLTDANLDTAAAAAIAVDPSVGLHPASDPGGPTPAEYVTNAVRKLRESLTSRLVGTRSQDPASYRTQRWHSDGLLAAETAAGEWLRAPCAEPAGVAIAELDTEGLSPDQAAAAQLVTGCQRNGCAIVGVGGSGKTTTLARIVDAVGRVNVLAVAPTASAAATLAEKLGTHAQTVALSNITSTTHSSPIPTGGLVIIDEATQLGTRDLASLVGHCAARGARLAVIGDNAQQGSIAAGAVFDTITSHQHIPTAALTQPWRFEDPDEAAATAQLRLGRPEALDYHRQRGRVTDGAAAHAPRVAGEWWERHRDSDTLISASRIETTTLINIEIAERRAELGETGEIVARIARQPIALHEIIVTRKNNRRLVATGGRTVNNGDRWRVTGTTPSGGLTVAHVDKPDAVVVLPRRYVARRVQLGYAITHTRAQSLTVDHSLTLIDASTAREPLYVGMSRGAKSNHLHIITDVAGHDPDTPTEHHPPDRVLKTVLERTQLRHTAADIARSHAHDSPALHLHLIARTPHNKPLPVPERFDGTRWLADPTTAAARSADSADVHHDLDDWAYEAEVHHDLDDWAYEAEVQAAMAEWHQEQRHDDIAARIEAGAYDDEAANIDQDDYSIEHIPPDLDPEPFLAEELAGLDHPDHPDPQYDHARVLSSDEPEEGHHLAYDYEGDPEMAALTVTRPAEDRRKPHPGDTAQQRRVGIDIDAVQAAVRQRGLAAWAANRFGVKTDKRSGNRIPIECPLHRPGHTRSAAIYTDGARDTFTCFRCGESGLDAIALAEKHDRIGFGEALQSIAAELGVTETASYTANPAPPRPTIDMRPAVVPSDALALLSPEQRSRVVELLGRCDAPDSAVPVHPAVLAAAHAAEAAHKAGDPAAQRRAAARFASLSDPSTARRLARNRINPDDEPAARTIRAEIAAARLAHHAAELEELAELRTQGLQGDERATAAAGFAAAVHNWLDDPAASPLSLHYADSPPQQRHFVDCDELGAAYLAYAGATAAASPLPPPTITHSHPSAIAAAVAARPQTPDQSDGTTAQGWAALQTSADWYQQQLHTDTPDAAAARRYLAKRGITADDWCRWGIGWAPDGWQAMCDHIDDDQLAYDVGVAARSANGRTYDFFRGRITFELRDRAGRVIGFAGRTLDPDDNAKYINSRNTSYYQKSRTLFGADQAAAAIAATRTAVVVEGYTDVIAAHRHGNPNTVAACGTAIGDNHICQLRNLGADTLTACLDSDRAGDTAAVRLVRTAAAHQTPAKIAHLPPGTDPADITAAQLHECLADAWPAVVSAVAAAVDHHDPADAASTADELAAVLACHDLHDPAIAAAARTALINALGSQWHRVAPPPAPIERHAVDQPATAQHANTVSR